MSRGSGLGCRAAPWIESSGDSEAPCAMVRKGTSAMNCASAGAGDCGGLSLRDAVSALPLTRLRPEAEGTIHRACTTSRAIGRRVRRRCDSRRAREGMQSRVRKKRTLPRNIARRRNPLALKNKAIALGIKKLPTERKTFSAPCFARPIFDRDAHPDAEPEDLGLDLAEHNRVH